MLENENSSFIYSMSSGAIRIKPLVKHVTNLIIKKSSFENMNSEYGGTLSLFEIGKVLVRDTNFTRI
jgi:hypothetical protein